MINSILIDIFSIIPLLFTINLAAHNIQNKKNRYYIMASATTIIILLMEIASFFIASSNELNTISLNHIVNIVGFSLSPIVPYSIVLYSNNMGKLSIHKKLLAIPLYLNVLICAFSYRTGWVYSIDAQNQYTRGALFLLPTIISMLYYALVVIEAFQKKAEFERQDERLLILLILLPLLATILQILFPELLLIWGSVTITLLVYYVFNLELQFGYDIQTGVRNRTAFEKEMQNCRNANATIFVFDINNLKKVNDLYGHKAGDDLIQDAVNVIKTCFAHVGQTYRIGGDEFCVICKDISKQSAEKLLADFDASLHKVNQTRSNKFRIAYGYASFNQRKGESIYTAFSQADNAMYVHKAKLKAVYGRRWSDR